MRAWSIFHRGMEEMGLSADLYVFCCVHSSFYFFGSVSKPSFADCIGVHSLLRWDIGIGARHRI